MSSLLNDYIKLLVEFGDMSPQVSMFLSKYRDDKELCSRCETATYTWKVMRGLMVPEEKKGPLVLEGLVALNELLLPGQREYVLSLGRDFVDRAIIEHFNIRPWHHHMCRSFRLTVEEVQEAKKGT